MKYLLIGLLLLSNKSYSQTDLESCSKDYDIAIKNYLSNKDSLEYIVKLNESKYKWKECLMTKSIPKIILTNSKGVDIKLDSLQGKIYVVQFWASWCPPCMAEIPIINRLYSEFDSNKVKILTLSFNSKVAQENINKFSTNFIPNASVISKELGVLAYPTIYIISKKYRISKVYLGAEKDNIEKLYLDLKNNLSEELEK